MAADLLLVLASGAPAGSWSPTPGEGRLGLEPALRGPDRVGRWSVVHPATGEPAGVWPAHGVHPAGCSNSRSAGRPGRSARGGRRGGRRSGRRGGVVPASPNDSSASGQKLAARSPLRVWNGRSPTTWQIELIEQVTWCASAMRTSPPQKNAVSAPCQDQVTSAGHGRGEQRRHRQGHDHLVDAADVLVGEQVGSEPLAVRQAALEEPAAVRINQALGDAADAFLYRQGEWGSPSRSLKAWRRRSATHLVGLPPGRASRRRSRRPAA